MSCEEVRLNDLGHGVEIVAISAFVRQRDEALVLGLTLVKVCLTGVGVNIRTAYTCIRRCMYSFPEQPEVTYVHSYSHTHRTCMLYLHVKG